MQELLANQKGTRIGEVAEGWTRQTWIAELRRMAAVCELLHPEMAKRYRIDAWSVWFGRTRSVID